MTKTVEEVADHIAQGLSGEDRKYIRDAPMGELHHGFGTWIRNTYRLWHDHPLTLKWRTDPTSHEIRNGVDYSPDHPDNICGKIIEAVKARL